MMKQKVGVIHPGMMGICVAATVHNSGHEVYWAAEGRSPQSRQRAEKFNLENVLCGLYQGDNRPVVWDFSNGRSTRGTRRVRGAMVAGLAQLWRTGGTKGAKCNRQSLAIRRRNGRNSGHFS